MRVVVMGVLVPVVSVVVVILVVLSVVLAVALVPLLVVWVLWVVADALVLLLVVWVVWVVWVVAFVVLLWASAILVRRRRADQSMCRYSVAGAVVANAWIQRIRRLAPQVVFCNALAALAQLVVVVFGVVACRC